MKSIDMMVYDVISKGIDSTTPILDVSSVGYNQLFIYTEDGGVYEINIKEIDGNRMKATCNTCGSTDVRVIGDINEEYPDDYYIVCMNCDNWEEGAMPFHSFEVSR